MRKTVIFTALLLCLSVQAQQDTIQLREVVVTDVPLREFSDNVTKITLTDSILQNNQGNLAHLLSQNTALYFKENGRGMVTSPSFRGTTAQQTAVIWNGININSQFNGQTDFSTVNPLDFSSVTVRSGGGSVLYGSGAIGGTIHLNSDVGFQKLFRVNSQLYYGSFGTQGIHTGVQKSTEKLIAKIDISHNQSDNDYPYIGYNKLKNENGNYENVSLNGTFGYKFNPNNSLKLFSYYYDGIRHFSGTIAVIGKSKYLNTDTRTMLEWQNTTVKNLVSKLKIAQTTEEYSYYENKNTNVHSGGKARTNIMRNDLVYKFSNNLKFSSIIELNATKGEGSSIGVKERTITAFGLVASHRIFEKVSYEASARGEITSNYKSPFLYSYSMNYKPFSFYGIRASVSRNFRIPTYNDLYWQGSGNPDLKPENSFQYEISNDWTIKKFTFTITAFRNQLSDMLRWLPNTSGLWLPQNTEYVSIRGIEAVSGFSHKFGGMALQANSSYSFTESINEKTDKLLIYVPLHRFSGNISLSYKKVGLVYNYNYNGLVYTSTDNKHSLPDYGVHTAGGQYGFLWFAKWNIGFKVLNITNEAYQNVIARPMPGRNYMFNLNLSF